MRARRVCAVLAAAVVSLSGCGSDVAAERGYTGAVQRAERTFVARFDAALAGLGATSTLAQDRTTVAAYAQITRAFAAALARTDPPPAVRAEHRALLAAVARSERQIERARGLLVRGSADDRAVARTQLSSSVAVLQRQASEAVSKINVALG